MSTATSRLALLKPAGSEDVNVGTQLNNNFDAIDLNMNFRSCTSSTRPSTAYAGLSIRETDTSRLYVSNGSAPVSASWVEIPNGVATYASNLTFASSGVINIGDTNLYRSATNVLKTDDSLTVGGNLSVTGIGQMLYARKSSDTARATATLSDDPHLTTTVVANAEYVVEMMLHWYTSDETNADLNLDFTIPASATGNYLSFAQPTSGTTTDGTVRTMSTVIDAARTYGADSDTANPSGMLYRGVLITGASGGTYAVQFARTGASGTLTMLANSYMKLTRVA